MRWLLIFLLIFYPVFQEKESVEIWLEVHDLSPGYSQERALNLARIAEKADKAVFFVIPCRDNREPISSYPEFTSLLKELEERGIIIGMHGYSHRGFEYLCSGDRTEMLTALGKREFERAGIEPEAFFPPRYLIGEEALKLSRKEFPEVYLFSGIYEGEKKLPYIYRDVTFLPALRKFSLPLAEFLYLMNTQEVYRLSVHMNDADSETIETLEKFLSFAGGKGKYKRLSCSELLERAEKLEAREIKGIKRNSYALLYHVNLYRATGDEKQLRKAKRLAQYLASLQHSDGSFHAVEGESASSYSLLESSAATLALSEYYSISGDESIREAVVKGGEHLVKKIELLSFFGLGTGLKPNAIGFAALALGKASSAIAGDEAEAMREEALKIGYTLLKLQRSDGAFYDGPYWLPTYEWRRISPWYQAMALSGLAEAYAVETPGERLELKSGAEKAIEFLKKSNFTGESSEIMVLQSYAIAEASGISTPYAELVEKESNLTWDANYAFALSLLAAVECSRG